MQEVANSDNKWIEEEDTSRRAKWWYSTFHTVTAMIGAGVLSLPYAMAYLGWYIYIFELDSTYIIFRLVRKLAGLRLFPRKTFLKIENQPAVSDFS